ncbi:putative selenoprotein M [Operophtera brumata]|uniref:Selenoprotein M n=1 Tax=Operophtera brumata TaxID=104452 RepID=A0A0L7L873_OPEBR|nr:putative selenoprotein M [Operophtera brumata]
MRKLVVLLTVIFAVTAYEIGDIVSARIETCRGCSLNRLPQVKQFVMQDATEYGRLDVHFINGAPPELVVLGEGDKELERLALSHLDRNQCNELVQSKGFSKKAPKADL